MLILQTTDIVPCKIGKLTVWVSPLSWSVKTRLLKHSMRNAGVDETDDTGLLFDTLKYSIKQVDGLENYDILGGGHPEMKFDENVLSDESTELLIRIVGMAPISQLSSVVLAETWSEKMSDVEIDFPNAKKKN